jgi:hypothetical protein
MKGLLSISGLVVLLFAAACNHNHEEKQEPETISITKWTGEEASCLSSSRRCWWGKKLPSRPI